MTERSQQGVLSSDEQVIWGGWEASGALRWSKEGKLQQHFLRHGEVFKQMYGRDYRRQDEWRDVPTEVQS